MAERSQDDDRDLFWMPEVITIYPDGYKWGGWLVLLLVFLGLWVALFVVEPTMALYLSVPMVGIVGYYFVIVLPESTRLRITPAGLTVRYLFFEHRYEWESINSFFVEPDRQGNAVSVLIIRHQPVDDINLLVVLWERFSPAPERGTIVDAYSLPPEELARFLNSCRLCFTAIAEEDSGSEDGTSVKGAMARVRNVCRATSGVTAVKW